LNAANNPQIRFEARRIERTGGSSARVIGNLTLHGVTREQSLDVVFNAARESLIDGRFMTGFSATASVLRSAFGLDLFAELVSDEVRIEIEAEFALTPG
jgi:polyisoprenoid-binding protein YceI